MAVSATPQHGMRDRPLSRPFDRCDYKASPINGTLERSRVLSRFEGKTGYASSITTLSTAHHVSTSSSCSVRCAALQSSSSSECRAPFC